MPIDIHFKMNSDANGKDPDSHSPTLRAYHQQLWSKALPNGKEFTIERLGQYLGHSSDMGTFYLGSDAITHSYKHHERKRWLTSQIPDGVDALFDLGLTIGAYTLFPNNRIDMKPTINGARGMSAMIDDRFDLTLECIRRHYEFTTKTGEMRSVSSSPLGAVLARYADFFSLFESFEGYVNFFLLQDLVAPDESVKFYLPFDDFQTRPTFQSVDDYRRYRSGVMAFLAGRNGRIADSVKIPASEK